MELLVAVAIMALLAGAASFAVIPILTRVRRDSAEQNADHIRRAVISQRVIEASTCPTVRGMIDANVLDEGTPTRDPWGSPFVITCHENGRIEVRSAGLDKLPNTADDIAAPKPR